MKERMSTIILAALLLVLSAVSLFVGVIDVTPIELFRGNMEQLEIFLISRLPRLLAIICTGVGMSTAGLIMQQLCMNKFVSPTTGATISSAQFGILLVTFVYAAVHAVGAGNICIYHGDSRNMDFCVVHTTNSV